MSHTSNDEVMSDMTYFMMTGTAFLEAGRLGVYAIAVLSALAYHANLKDSTAFPSIKTIAKEIGCSERKVQETVKALHEAGLITIKPRFTQDGDRTSNLYIVHYHLEVVHRMHHPGARGAEELNVVELEKKMGLTPLPNGGLEY